MHLYNSLAQEDEKHKSWLGTIREVVSERIIQEEDRVPMHTSLWRHWKRSCWISQMWQQSNQANVFSSLPVPEDNGWTLQSDRQCIIDWESPEVQQQIKDNIEYLIKGCSCKKGCKSLKCGCRKKMWTGMFVSELHEY